VLSIWTLNAPSPPSVLRPKSVKPVSPGFEAKPFIPSHTPPHDVTNSSVFRPNWSNRRCRRMSDLLPSLDAIETFVRTRCTGHLTRHRPRRLNRRCFHHHILLLFRAPSGPPMTSPGLLGSLGPGLLALTFHHFGPSA